LESGQILVVEEPLVRRLIHGILTRDGYTVVEAEPGHALKLLADTGANIALLVTNTPELFVDYAGRLALLYVSMDPEDRWAKQFVRCRLLPKPFQPHKLVELTHELLEPVKC
jgi:CheY-like chemotaxis protein